MAGDGGADVEFYVPPTAWVILRLDLDLKSHLKDWRAGIELLTPGLQKE